MNLLQEIPALVRVRLVGIGQPFESHAIVLGGLAIVCFRSAARFVCRLVFSHIKVVDTRVASLQEYWIRFAVFFNHHGRMGAPW
jgi:hypothetical protein